MNAELFKRLKKLAEQEGHVVIAENDGAFVLMSLDEYEGCASHECECDYCEDEDNEIEEVIVKDNTEETEAPDTNDDDKELLRKVNEDIAKWRAEQERKNQENNILINQDNKKEEKNDASAQGILEDEERYYLEPLE